MCDVKSIVMQTHNPRETREQWCKPPAVRDPRVLSSQEIKTQSIEPVVLLKCPEENGMLSVCQCHDHG